jgi:predicted branched-subunit amino acid permease
MIEEIRRGAVANLPVGASVAAYGSVLGMLAAQKGLTWLQLLAMNLSVFAGSAQFVMVEMWAPPLPVVEMILAVLIINMRYLLIGASLHPLFVGKSLAHKAGIMHLVADENWAVTMAAYRRKACHHRFFAGRRHLPVQRLVHGHLAGPPIGSAGGPAGAFALDFAFVAVFTALTVSMWRGKRTSPHGYGGGAGGGRRTTGCPANGTSSSAASAGHWFRPFRRFFNQREKDGRHRRNNPCVAR